MCFVRKCYEHKALELEENCDIENKQQSNINEEIKKRTKSISHKKEIQKKIADKLLHFQHSPHTSSYTLKVPDSPQSPISPGSPESGYLPQLTQLPNMEEILKIVNQQNDVDVSLQTDHTDDLPNLSITDRHSVTITKSTRL